MEKFKTGEELFREELENPSELKDKEIEQLKKNFKKYGKHLPDCELDLFDYFGQCTCGFEQALKKM